MLSEDALNLVQRDQPTQGEALRRPGPLSGPQPPMGETTPLEALRISYINSSGSNTQTGLNVLAEQDLIWLGAVPGPPPV